MWLTVNFVLYYVAHCTFPVLCGTLHFFCTMWLTVNFVLYYVAHCELCLDVRHCLISLMLAGCHFFTNFSPMTGCDHTNQPCQARQKFDIHQARADRVNTIYLNFFIASLFEV